MNPFKWALSVVLALSISGCSVYSTSEVEHMQANLSEISLELNRLKTQMTDSDKKILYALMSIDERINTLEPARFPVSPDVPPAEVPWMEAPGGTPPPPPDVPSLTVQAPGADAAIPPALETVKPIAISDSAAAAVAPGGEVGEKPLASVVDLPGAQAKPADAPNPGPPAAPPSADEILQSATEAWKRGDTVAARGEFERFLINYPNHPDAGEASFWIGECNYMKKRFPEALQAYELVLNEYAGSPREAEAAAKIGYCYFYQNDMDKARAALQKVLVNYPSYERLSSVQQMLDSLK